MYEIKSGNLNIEGQQVPIFKRKVVNLNALEVIAGTSGYRGGRKSKTSRTYISIKDLDKTDMHIKPVFDVEGKSCGLEMVLGGDSELETMIRALKFITQVLEEESEGLRN